MKQKLKSFALNPLIMGSFLLFSGGILGSLFNFLFNLYMSRNLKVEDYGTLISLMSIITLISIPAGAFIPTILTVAGKYFAKNDFSHLHSFYFKMLKLLVSIGAILLVTFLLFSSVIGNFFHIDNPLLLTISAFSIFLVYVASISNAFLQAKLAFRALTFSNAISAASKLVVGFIFVVFGFGLSGAVVGLFVSFLLPVIIGFVILWKIIFITSENPVKISFRELVSYGIPSALVIFSLNAFISTDILLVKHLFSDFQAGQYAGLSLIGRVIFFLTAPISTVMFPIIINRINTNREYKKILHASLLLVGCMSLFITVFYFIFPVFTIHFFLKNEAYIAISSYLGRFGIFITIYSLVSVLAYYFLSIKKTSIMWVLLSGALLQAILIYFYHGDITQIINISTTILLFTLIYLFYILRKPA